MPRARTKLLNHRSLNFIPLSINVGDLESLDEESGDSFEFSDLSEGVEKQFDSLEYEYLMLHILFRLKDREKVVFLYMLVRDMGFNIDNTSFSKTLDLNRSTYSTLVTTVGNKVKKIIEANKQDNK